MTPPIPIHLASNKVHLEVALGDRDPVWMLLDSGANVTILNRELAEEMGLELRNETVGDQAAGGGSSRVAFTDVPDYRVPGLLDRVRELLAAPGTERRLTIARPGPSGAELEIEAVVRLRALF